MKMVGTNKMQFNQPTMCAIVQFWIDNKFTDSPGKVCEVEEVNGQYTTEFVVYIEAPAAENEEHA